MQPGAAYKWGGELLRIQQARTWVGAQLVCQCTVAGHIIALVARGLDLVAVAVSVGGGASNRKCEWQGDERDEQHSHRSQHHGTEA
jgi:hypothetical protein